TIGFVRKVGFLLIAPLKQEKKIRNPVRQLKNQSDARDQRTRGADFRRANPSSNTAEPGFANLRVADKFQSGTLKGQLSSSSRTGKF
ncbi:MAG: hypothetical protein AB9M53_06740, partial [Leptothrix sp. (in: b-proteobacteria)]